MRDIEAMPPMPTERSVVRQLAQLERTESAIVLASGMAAVAAVSFGVPSVSFLWHNVIGAAVVVAVGSVLSLGDRKLQTGTLQTDKL